MKLKQEVPFLPVVFSLCLNIAGNYIGYENSYRFLYLDMIGTLVAAVILGPIWGMGVGLLSNLITSFSVTSLIYFSPVNAIGGLYWGVLAQVGRLTFLRDNRDRVPVPRWFVPRKTLVILGWVGIGGGVVTSLPASVVESYIFNHDTGSYSSYLSSNFGDGGLSYFTDLWLSVPDKIVTAIVGIMLAVFLFRFQAIRLTENYRRSDQSWSKRLRLAFLEDRLGQSFLFIVSLLCSWRMFISGKVLPTDSHFPGSMESTPAILSFVTLYWYVIFAFGLLLLGTQGNKSRETSTKGPINGDLDVPQLVTLSLAVVACGSMLFILSCHLGIPANGMSPQEYYLAMNNAPSPDWRIVASLLVILACVILQDWNNTRIFANYREGVRLTEIEVLKSNLAVNRQELKTMQSALLSAKRRSEELVGQNSSLMEKVTVGEEIFDDLSRLLEAKENALKEQENELGRIVDEYEARIRSVSLTTPEGQEKIYHELKTKRIELENIDKELKGAQERICDLEEDLRESERDIRCLKLQLANKNSDNADHHQEETPPEFENVHDVVIYAKSAFADHLVFLDSAIKSAEKSPFRRPDKIYETLRALHRVTREWSHAKTSGDKFGDWGEALKTYGIEYKPRISQTSEGKYGDEYRFQYKGHSTLFDHHITVGAKQADKCLSIHVFRDEADGKVVIGHVGRHLTNTTT